MTPEPKTLEVSFLVSPDLPMVLSLTPACLETNPGGAEDTSNPDNQTLTQELKTRFQGLKFSGQQ